jgi:AcrR family transcriptional regulator
MLDMTRREAILRAAKQLFAKQGYDGTSTAEIAKRAGVAHGTVFHHFKTKENLLLEMGGQLADAYLEGLDALRLGEGTGWEALERTLRYHFSFMKENSRGIVVMVQESPRVFDSDSRGAHARHIRRCMASVRTIRRALLERGQADGSLRACPLEPTLFLLESLLNGLVNLQARDWADPPENLEEETVAFCRHSLVAGV